MNTVQPILCDIKKGASSEAPFDIVRELLIT